MYLRTFEVRVLKYMSLILLLMVKKGIGGGIYHCIYRYAEANNKCMKDYDKNKES